jgi:hypothetical protein
MALGLVLSEPQLRSNPQFQGSAEQQRCSVPVMLRMPAPPERGRYSAKISLARLAGCESRSGKG